MERQKQKDKEIENENDKESVTEENNKYNKQKEVPK